MAEEQGAQEKTEEPTEKKKGEVRDKGQVPRSRELNTVISLLLSSVGMLIFGEVLVEHLAGQMENFLSVEPAQLADTHSIIAVSHQALVSSSLALMPVLVVVLFSAFLGPVVMGGWLFQLSALQPKLEKLDPIKGLGKIFSGNGLMELIKALSKFLLIASVAALLIILLIQEILGIGLQTLELSLVHTGSIISMAFVVLSSVLVLVAAVDVPFQRMQFSKKIRMSKQEVRDEMKETDGRPEVKSRIRALQQEVSRRRMMDDLKEADVVITNPTHFAVALKYEDNGASAPVVVAKGVDHLAFRIIEVAKHHDVLVFEAPPLARALYASTDLAQEIPAGLYVAVAQVLAYVFQLKNPGFDEQIQKPNAIEIPEDYRDLI